MAKKLGTLIGFIVVCQLAGATGALITDASWYRALDRPSWAPPGWVFGPVWITLYTMMGVAAWLIWQSRAPRRRAALAWFAVQLVLNAAWTPVFFGARSIGGGLIVIVALLVAIIATSAVYRHVSRVAAALMVPYLAWVSFATALNAALWLRA
ncbi:MAG: tryptophan-rich sensory protein [Deltaproteobacteria bacterium]|nr:tryptophan-rich sensory protein [Deltaproteobacteria bacterium]